MLHSVGETIKLLLIYQLTNYLEMHIHSIICLLLVLTYPSQYPISKPTKIAPKFDEQEQAAAGQVCHIEESRILLAIITLDVDAFESLLDYTDIIHMTHISTYTQTLHCCATL